MYGDEIRCIAANIRAEQWRDCQRQDSETARPSLILGDAFDPSLNDQNESLAGEFVYWANRHDIPYDSPSYLSRGWLLGRRLCTEYTEQHYVSGHNLSDTGTSYWKEDYSIISLHALVVTRLNHARELTVVGATIGMPEKHHDFFARFRIAREIMDLGVYSLDGIKQSIARLSVKHNVRWDAA